MKQFFKIINIQKIIITIALCAGALSLLQTDDLKSQDVFWTTLIQTGESIKQISSGGTDTNKFACVLFSNGRVKCWGANNTGQLGYGNTTTIGDDESPISQPYVNIGAFVKQISASREHACALTAQGTVRCWGQGANGRLGYGNANDIGDNESPASVGDVSVGGTVTQIAAGGFHTCAVLSDGAVRCWGLNSSGELGYNNTTDIGDDEAPSTAGDVTVGFVVKKVVTGSSSVCALSSDGRVRCWGVGNQGRLGYGNNNDIGDNEIPSSAGDVNVGAVAAKDITSGSRHVCVLLVDGNVKCWGYNAEGQLGQGNTNDIGDNELPSTIGNVNIGGLAKSVAAYKDSSCVVRTDGETLCWGLNNSGELGYGNTVKIGDDEAPNTAGILANGTDGKIIQIAPGNDFNCALYTTGKIKCWGINAQGQLGYADTTQRGHTAATTPDKLGYVGTGGEVAVKQVTASGTSSCALLSNGNMVCWGSNTYGNLGYGHTTGIGGAGQKLPSQVGRVPINGKIIQIAQSDRNTCVLLQGGTVRCWGEGADGALGASSTTQIGDTEAAGKNGDISVGNDVIQITSNRGNVCALLKDGNVKCWGRNDTGQLGQGNTTYIGDNELPSTIGNVTLGAEAIYVGSGQAKNYAILKTGAVQCWGSNATGACGIADITGSKVSVGDNEAANAYGTISLSGNATQVTGGNDHTCALLESGEVQCWGTNTSGQLGYGHTNTIGDDEAVNTAGIVSLGEKAIQVVAGLDFSCALMVSGRVKCWGNANEGQLGYGNTTVIGDNELPSTVGYVSTGASVIQLATNTTAAHVCALLETGNVLCWGKNDAGQLGIGNNNNIGDNELPSSSSLVKLLPVPDNAAPPNPSNFTGTPVSGPYINLAWVSGGGSTCDFRISYQTGASAPADCATGTTISEASIYGNAYSVTGLTQSTQYSFRVCAINCDSPTPEVSNGVTVTATTWQDPPPNPTGLTATAVSDTQINLSWTSGGGTTSDYRISYLVGAVAPTTCSTGNTISEGSITGTSHSVTGLTANTMYTFRVCAINSNPTPDESSGVTAVATTFPAFQNIYRSVGPSNTNILACGTTGGGCTGQGNLTIAGTTATFASGVANNIGVGDVIYYDCSADASLGASDCVAFIHGRTSSTAFTVKNAAGTSSTAYGAAAVWSVYRAYTSLLNAETGTENSAITTLDATVGDFDTWSGGRDLYTNNQQWNIALYGDAQDTAGPIRIDGWTTTTANYLRLFTPVSSTEVGTSQRHTGVWSTSAYNYYNSGNNNNSFWVSDDHVRIEGLQIESNAKPNAQDALSITALASGADLLYKDNIVKLSGAWTGSHSWFWGNATASTTVKVVNNLFYADSTYSSGASLNCLLFENATWYVYNNTVAGCINVSYVRNSGTVVAKNNISQGSTGNSYSGTFDAASGYNLSDDATSTGGTGDVTNKTVAFINSTSNDYRLASTDVEAKDLGTNLSADPNYAFSTDIGANPRPGGVAWDMGASESATATYRSVGPSNTNILACGTTGGGCTGQGNLTISGSTATFVNGVANNVGVGDAIVYDCSSNASLGASDCVAFINSRTSNTVYTIKTNTGATPTAYGAATVWRIYRAYTSLSNAETGTENTAISTIDATLGNFDTWSGGRDLVANNQQWNITLYADATDTAEVVVDGWTTSGSHSLKIYTPTASTEVGVSQRHTGSWASGGYLIDVAVSADDSTIEIKDDNVEVNGLRIRQTEGGTATGVGVRNNGSTGSVTIKNNLIRSELGTTNSGLFVDATPVAIINFINNIIYVSGAAGTVGLQVNSGVAYIYNNTIYGAAAGVDLNSASAVGFLKNNIVQNSSAWSYDCSGRCDATSNYNLADDTTTTGGANDLINKTVTFMDTASYDFRISSLDISAKNAGTSLSADTNYPFSTDIRGVTRPSGAAWDIGAYESLGDLYRSVGNTATALATGTGNDLTIANGVATFASAIPDNVGVGDVIQYDSDNNASIDAVMFIHERNSSTSYDVRTAVGLLPADMAVADQNWSIFRAYTTLNLLVAFNENDGITDTVENFDTTAVRDLVANGTSMNIALYYSSTTEASTGTISFSSQWVTSSANRLRLFTPYLSTHVGISQRHNGYNSTPSYRLDLTNLGGITFSTSYVDIDGVYFVADGTSNSSAFIDFSPAAAGNVRFSNNFVYNLMKDNFTSNSALRGDGGSTYYVWNNIFVGLNDSGDRAVYCNGSTTSFYMYNNTSYNNTEFVRLAGCSGSIKNNLAQNSQSNTVYNVSGGAVDSSSSNNVSDKNDAPGTGAINSSSVAFVATVLDDYRLDTTDTVAKGAGVNLSSDPSWPFTTDIQNNTRSTWDIGASKAIAAFTTFTVNTTNDVNDASAGNGVCNDGSGNCSIRAAIQESNALTGEHIVSIPDGTYTLTLGAITVSSRIHLVGTSQYGTVIHGNGARVFSDGITATGEQANLLIKNLTFRNATVSAASDSGGAIKFSQVRSQLALQDCAALYNTTSGTSSAGGAVYTAGFKTQIDRCYFGYNGVTDSIGGAASLTSTDVLVQDSTFIGNYNTSVGAAGAIHLGSSGSVLQRNYFEGNTLSSGRGMAIALLTAGTHVVQNNTFYNQSGGISVVSTDTSGNTTYVKYNTFYKNTMTSDAVLLARNSSNIQIQSNIFYANTGGNDCAIATSGTITNNGYNMASTAGTGCSFAGTDLASATHAQIGLGFPAYNGGYVKTMALLSGSSGLDAGSNTNCPLLDGRGQPRPMNGGSSATCDRGAYEAQLAPTSNFYVNTTTDNSDASAGDGSCADAGGLCSIRAALEESNSLAGTQTIYIPDGYYSIGAEIAISADVTITGATKYGTILDGGGSGRIFNISSSADNVSMSYVTLQNANNTAGSGGAVLADGVNLTFSQCVISGNTGTVSGIGVYLNSASSSISMSDCEVYNNVITSGSAVIYVGSTVDGNATFNRVYVHDNSVVTEGAVFLSNTTGTRTVSNSTFSFNKGERAPITSWSGTPGTITFENLTIYKNTSTGTGAADGCGLHSVRAATLINSTIVGNNCNSSGSGAGVSQGTGYTLQLSNNIIAWNYRGTTLDNCSGAGTFTSNGYNLSDSAECSIGTGSNDQSNVTDIKLYTLLANHGGTVPTVASIAGSQAIDAGTTTSAPTSDARGNSRYDDGGVANVSSSTDIGGFERQGGEPPNYITYQRSWAVFMQYQKINNMTPTTLGTVTSYSVSPTLPKGLSLNTSTGVISGTPLEVLRDGVKYTITATNSYGSATAELTIRVWKGYLVNSTTDQAASGSTTDDVCDSTASTCTLRAAVSEAVGVGGYRVILVGTRTITQSGTLGLNENIAVVGDGYANSIIDANTGNNSFNVAAAKTVFISDVDIRNGRPTSANGGAINVSVASANLYLSNCRFYDNRTITSGDGGAVYTTGSTLDIEYCLFESNIAAGQGAGFMANETNTNVRFSTFKANSAPTRGSAFKFRDTTNYDNTLNIESSLFDSNTTSYPVVTMGGNEIWFKNNTYYNNTGSSTAGIAYHELISHTGTLNIHYTNNTFKDNQTTSATGTGGITIEGNAAAGRVINLFLANNLFYNNNYNTSTKDDCNINNGTATENIVSLGGNWIDTATGDCNTGGSDVLDTGTDPFNGNALTSNGGPTNTIKIHNAGSAVEAGVLGAAYTNICEGRDARGYRRPYDRDGNGVFKCDVGAVELQSAE